MEKMGTGEREAPPPEDAPLEAACRVMVLASELVDKLLESPAPSAPARRKKMGNDEITRVTAPRLAALRRDAKRATRLVERAVASRATAGRGRGMEELDATAALLALAEEALELAADVAELWTCDSGADAAPKWGAEQ